jgi:uncharacterized protein
MGQNVDTVKQAWEAYSRGDLDSATEVFHGDARWEASNSQRVPGGGTFEGREAIRDMAAGLADPWESFQPTPDEFIEQGDTVIVLGHTEAKAKETGKDIQVPFVQIWRMSDGKAERVQALTDTAVVAEAIES